jgi:hypothetical protein
MSATLYRRNAAASYELALAVTNEDMSMGATMRTGK